ncbi:DUF4190 domain-containing protein [Coraliomargarita parva]|uniref:DUF4190 domain-containing protein n=1 Tax=Coraliomargarita parva TaxID=3014050 RepID=UPI0022B4508D|nr:DUF4190 domain-containing protein [Coraliomargarita parva]
MSQTAKTCGMAVASFLFGILFFVPFGFLLAIIFGFIALSRIKDSNGELKGKGLAIAGLVLGFGWVAIIPIVGLLAAMAIPAFQKVRETSMEKMMENNARMISSASQQYMLENGVSSVGFDALLQEYLPETFFNELNQPGADTTVELQNGSFELINPQFGRRYVFDSDGRLIEVFELSQF